LGRQQLCLYSQYHYNLFVSCSDDDFSLYALELNLERVDKLDNDAIHFVHDFLQAYDLNMGAVVFNHDSIHFVHDFL